MRRNKTLLLWILLNSSLAITMPLITSCYTTLEETVVPPVVDIHNDCYFKSTESGCDYCFHDVDSYLVNCDVQHLLFKNCLDVYVYSDDYKFFFNVIWKCNEQV